MRLLAKSRKKCHRSIIKNHRSIIKDNTMHAKSQFNPVLNIRKSHFKHSKNAF